MFLKLFLIVMSCMFVSGPSFSQQISDVNDDVQELINSVDDLRAKMKEHERMLASTESNLSDLERRINSEDANVNPAKEVTSAPIIVTAAKSEAKLEPPSEKTSKKHDAAVIPEKRRTTANLNQAPISRSASEIRNEEYQFELSPEVSYITYKEPSLNVKENGAFIGIHGAYYARPYFSKSWAINVVKADAHANYGLVKYKSDDGTATNINDYLLEPRVWFGHDLQLASESKITPYWGIGYRFLYDTFSKAGEGGYDRRSQYFYSPLGFEFLTKASDDWNIGLNAEYDIFIRGWQTSYLSQANTGVPRTEYPDLTNQQKKGFGFRASIDLIKKSDAMNFLLSPYVRYWHIKQSDTRTVQNESFIVEGYEPENKSTEIGLQAGIEF